MPECFCGCAKKIRFTARGMNKQGRRTVGLVATLREAGARIELGESADNPVLLATLAGEARGIAGLLDDLIERGEEFEVFWMHAVHDVYLPPPSEARQVEQACEAWGRTVKVMIDAVGVPTERSWEAAIRADV
jgi:hypothetical protein